MKKYEELGIKTQSNILTLSSIFITIIGIIILSIGLADIFMEDKGSFWSILYSIVGFVMVFTFRFRYKTFLECKKLEKELP
jgi:uncharacterized membrane protein